MYYVILFITKVTNQVRDPNVTRENILSHDEKKLYETSLNLHTLYRGKIEVFPKVPVEFKYFALWYTPGVAEPSRRISSDPDLSFELTWRWNTVAIVSDGTRVLGLGNIGPEAALPVMEGKALLFKYLGGVDAVPLVVRERDSEKLIYIVKALEPAFGGINLEDIESPKCFYLLERLRQELNIPVWHDDQQGTALVTIAGLINALRIVGKKLQEISVAVVGAGAAGLAIVKYLIVAGVKPGNIYVVDSKGILWDGRPDLLSDDPRVKWKREVAKITNAEQRKGGIPDAMKGVDVLIAVSKPGPGVIKKEWIRLMNDDPIVFAEANPVPEIWPWEAKEAGARVVATGRSDFPNQVNNSLGFPAVFRGALTVRAKKITDEMCITAAYALANYAEKKGISEDYIIPRMDETEAYVEEAIAVAEKAMEIGVARRKIPREELESEVRELIMRPKEFVKLAYGKLIRKPQTQ